MSFPEPVVEADFVVPGRFDDVPDELAFVPPALEVDHLLVVVLDPGGDVQLSATLAYVHNLTEKKN